METITDFLIDLLLYGFIDAFVVYYFTAVFNNITVDFSGKDFKHITILDFLMCLVSLLCPFVFYSQFLSSLASGALFMFRTKKTDIVSYGMYCLPVVILGTFEYLAVYLFNGLLNQSILAISINSQYRIIIYIALKAFEAAVIFIWRRISMKLVVGGIVRR